MIFTAQITVPLPRVNARMCLQILSKMSRSQIGEIICTPATIGARNPFALEFGVEDISAFRD